MASTAVNKIDLVEINYCNKYRLKLRAQVNIPRDGSDVDNILRLTHFMNDNPFYEILANRAPALPRKNLMSIRYTKFSLPRPIWVLEFEVPRGPGVGLAGSCLC